MTKKKSTKRAFISSLLILAMCFTMLAGTTFAWFTDSVTSSGNIIKSGKLDVDLLVKGGNIDTATYGTDYVSLDANPGLAVFNYNLWEPGYTVVANAKVVNKGNLALKYTLKIAATGTASELAEVIDVYYAPSEVAVADRNLANNTNLRKLGTLAEVLAGGANVTINDYLLAGDAPDFATIALQMQTTAGNEYQEKSIGSGFTLQLLATQYTKEEDSFDEQYDASAEYKTVFVSNTTELAAAINSTEVADGAVVDGNGATVSTLNGANFRNDVEVKNITFEGNNGLRNGYANADVVFENCTFKGATYGAHFDGGNGSVTFKNCEFYGWNSFGGTLSKVTFENCTFHLSTNGYNCIRFYQNGEVKGCTFDSDFKWIDAAKDGIRIEISGCTGIDESKLFLNGTRTNVTWILDGNDVSAGIGSH